MSWTIPQIQCALALCTGNLALDIRAASSHNWVVWPVMRGAYMISALVGVLEHGNRFTVTVPKRYTVTVVLLSHTIRALIGALHFRTFHFWCQFWWHCGQLAPLAPGSSRTQ